MSSQWWEQASAAEAELHYEPDPRRDTFDPSDPTLPSGRHKCPESGPCVSCGWLDGAIAQVGAA